MRRLSPPSLAPLPAPAAAAAAARHQRRCRAGARGAQPGRHHRADLRCRLAQPPAAGARRARVAGASAAWRRWRSARAIACCCWKPTASACWWAWGRAACARCMSTTATIEAPDDATPPAAPAPGFRRAAGALEAHAMSLMRLRFQLSRFALLLILALLPVLGHAAPQIAAAPAPRRRCRCRPRRPVRARAFPCSR